jgi:acylphosphatase
MERMRAVVTGRVQGVGFRWSTRGEAERLGLVGFARNRTDGSVLVEAQGTADALAALREWLAHGPPSATVIDLAVETIEPLDGATGFTAR